MPCPICGANCKCRNRGLDGTCCPCHKHRGRINIRPEFYIKANLTLSEIAAVERHEKNRDKIFAAILADWHLRMRIAEYVHAPE